MHLVSNTSEPSASLLGFCLSGCHHFTLAADGLILHPCLVFLRTLFILKPFSAQLFIIIKIRLEAFCHPHSPHFPKTSIHLYNYIHTMAWHFWWCRCSIFWQKLLILKSFTFSGYINRVVVLLCTSPLWTAYTLAALLSLHTVVSEVVGSEWPTWRQRSMLYNKLTDRAAAWDYTDVQKDRQEIV